MLCIHLITIQSKHMDVVKSLLPHNTNSRRVFFCLLLHIEYIYFSPCFHSMHLFQRHAPNYRTIQRTTAKVQKETDEELKRVNVASFAQLCTVVRILLHIWLTNVRKMWMITNEPTEQKARHTKNRKKSLDVQMWKRSENCVRMNKQ